MLNKTNNWIGAGAFLGYLVATFACALSTGSNMSGFAGIIFGIPVGVIAGAIGAAMWKRKNRD